MTDELFRKFREFSNNIDEVHEENIDDFIDNQFNCANMFNASQRKRWWTVSEEGIFWKVLKNYSLSDYVSKI